MSKVKKCTIKDITHNNSHIGGFGEEDIIFVEDLKKVDILSLLSYYYGDDSKKYKTLEGVISNIEKKQSVEISVSLKDDLINFLNGLQKLGIFHDKYLARQLVWRLKNSHEELYDLDDLQNSVTKQFNKEW